MKRCKKPLSIILAVMMVIGLFSALPVVANAATSSDDNWDWFYNYGWGGISHYLGGANSGTLTVPHIIDGHTDEPMTLIEYGAFENCPQINELVVEEGYEQLDYAAFVNANINKVVLPSTITSIDEYIFAESSVREVEIKAATSIPDGMFYGCTNLTRITLPSTITSVGEYDVLGEVDTSKLTICVEAGSTTETLFKAIAPDATYEDTSSSHTHTWEVTGMTMSTSDRQTIEVELTCGDDGATSSTSITEYTPVDGTVNEATCLADGSMKINAAFTKDGQEITVGANSVSVVLPQYTAHDYSEQKWTWWDDTPTNCDVCCAHCTKDMYDDPNNCYSQMTFSNSGSPNNYLRTETNGDWVSGRLNTNHMFFSLIINNFQYKGTIYSDNNYAYYTDTAPHWEWADDYSYATATFDDDTVITDDDISSEQITDTLDGNKEKIRYVATINYRGNEYNSARKVDAPPATHTITWKNDDGTVINTTTVEDGIVPTHADAVKASTAEYDYTFAGWTPTVVAATADAEYTATFTPVKRSYTITWLNDDDSVIDTTTVEYGETPTHADATKAPSGCTAYTFAGWTPSIEAVTGEATYKASYTLSDDHAYNPVWYWTENEASYTAALKLTCSGCDDEVLLSGDDIDYDFNPFCTSYDGAKTTYHVSAEYNGVTYEETKTVPSIDTSNVIGNIALDAIMTTAADAKAQDENQFGLSDDVYYRNLTVLGVQKKEAIDTTDGQSTGTDLRFVAVAKSELLEDAQDYGFMVASSAQGVWNTDKAVGNLTAEAFPNSKYTCKDTDNTICGDYGKCDTDTDYKYITLAVNGVDENTTIAARFYIQDSNGVYHYAKYTNRYSKTYQGIAVKYSDLG